MAQLENRSELNVPGRFYVDDSCVDCDACRDLAPDFFRRIDDIGQTVVVRQPINAEEEKQCQEALNGCPTESIGNDG